MENLQERVQLRMEQIGITQSELSTIINKSPVTIYKILSGNQHNIMGTTLIDLSEALQCNPVWLQRGTGPITLCGGNGLLPFMQTFPVLTPEQLLLWPDYEEDSPNLTRFLPCFEPCSSKGFWFHIFNEDLIPKLEPLDLACLDPERKELENGKYIVIRFKKNNTIAVKQVKVIDSDIYLKTTNPLYPQNISFTPYSEIDHEILGTIISLIKAL